MQRWVDRLGWTNIAIEHASVSIERSARGRTSACLTLVLSGGRALSTAISRSDIYVAVADTFRDARKQLLGLAGEPTGSRLAIAG
ncbi:MAG TPA: hypothetical protein VNO30_35545 [Kofleriaceae bacterium]|nr:hypothetical protein [Kofleriaceae bacterium]